MNSNKWIRRAIYIFLLFFFFAMIMIKNGEADSAINMLVVALICSGAYIYLARHDRKKGK